MEWNIIKMAYLDGYKLQLTFKNGHIKVVDLFPYLDGEVFLPLKNIDYFKTVKLHPQFKTIYWDNGADFAPEFLFENSVEV